MRYFDYLQADEAEEIFYLSPGEFSRNSDKETLSLALGATLYMPAIKQGIAGDMIKCKNRGLKSAVLCLEDSIGDSKVDEGENMLDSALQELYTAIRSGDSNAEELPLIFIRVRSAEQMRRIAERAGESLDVVTGFVFPKFSALTGDAFFGQLEKISKDRDKRFFGMPILESPDIIYHETRSETMDRVAEVLERYNDSVLNIRIGGTDFSNVFGIRRSYDITIYDIAVLRDCISHIVNRFGRQESSYVISGPVWEYFTGGERVLKPLLRRTPFEQSYGRKGAEIRKDLLDHYVDGLLHEVVLDKANGLWGKTIIHPSHIIPVQSLYVVTHEEYLDACSIIESCATETGVLKSGYSNKMNEIKTHANWARKVIARAKIYGVFNENERFTSLLG